MRTISRDVPDEALSSVLFGKTRRRLLGWLFMHPDESFYVRQLARIIGASPGAVPRELKPLTSAGILERTSRGREVFYQANRKSPVFEELRGIILKSANPVRLPKEFRFGGNEVSIRRSGKRVILEPKKRQSWPKGYWQSWKGVPADFEAPPALPGGPGRPDLDR